jgi:hypothetical protein
MDRAKEKITLGGKFLSPRTFLTISLLTQKATFFSKHTALRGYLPFYARPTITGLPIPRVIAIKCGLCCVN